MLEELERRNYAPSTIRAYIRTVEHFARHFHCAPDKLGPDTAAPLPDFEPGRSRYSTKTYRY
jgi:hypothetical protein